jgi:peptidoglycan/xylan/chitin deacetylase (PgdA/CDA1 family)
MKVSHSLARLRRASVVYVFHDITDRHWFARCVDEITATRTVVSLREIAESPERQGLCALTFDDGLRSVIDIAHPVLHDARIPYTVFLCTEAVTGGVVPWFIRAAHLVECLGLESMARHWRLRGIRYRTASAVIAALKEVPFETLLSGLQDLEASNGVDPPDSRKVFMTEHEVRSLAGVGVTIGSHTHRHPILARLSSDQQRFEIEQSSELIEQMVGERPRDFAYPNGSPQDFTPTTIELLRDAGFRVAVTTTQRYVTSAADPLALPRIGFSDGDSELRRLVKTLAPTSSTSRLKERIARAGVLA